RAGVREPRQAGDVARVIGDRADLDGVPGLGHRLDRVTDLQQVAEAGRAVRLVPGRDDVVDERVGGPLRHLVAHRVDVRVAVGDQAVGDPVGERVGIVARRRGEGAVVPVYAAVRGTADVEERAA